MSAFAVVYEMGNTTVAPDAFYRAMERLDHRGPDGSDQFLSGNLSMGHWHFWTTPEEIGERQPLELKDSPFKLVFDGRLDNRSELLAQLKLNPSEGSLCSDAMLVLLAFERWGRDCVKHFVGEFAFVLFDAKEQELFCARDPLGDRTLYYGVFGSCFVIASEPWAVNGAGPVSFELDESAVAHYFAFQTPEDGRTFFKNVYELLPAHTLVINQAGKQLECYWKPDPSARVRYNSDEEYAEHFLALLDESVRSRLRSTTPVGVQMSGGLDSTSVACLAARALPPGTLTAISYIFDELPDCDERRYIDAVKKHANINSIQFVGDDFWPLKDWQSWQHPPSRPEWTLYRLLFKGVYSRAQQEGLRVLLTGTFGDYLYQGGRSYWLADLIAEAKMVDAIRELKLLFSQIGLMRLLREGCLQRALIKLSGVRNLLAIRRNQNHAWLTSTSLRFLSNWEAHRFDSVFNRHASVSILGLLAAKISAYEIPHASSYAVELRHPYRDRRLVEFVLALPAYQLYYHGTTKYILRNAMQGILPEVVRVRRQPTSLAPFYRKGAKSEKNVFEACYRKENAYWRKFVHEEQLLKLWQDGVSPESIYNSIIPWMCISFEKWLGLDVFQRHPI